jgi:hypothetical protein
MNAEDFVVFTEYWNKQKVFIDTDLWYVENILSEQELSELMRHANEENKWYKTMRSSSIRNKFIGVNVKTHPEGTICPRRGIDLSGDALFPNYQEDGIIQKDMVTFIKDGGIFDKLSAVLPPTLVKNPILQSFWPLDEEELKDPGGAYGWHSENGTIPESESSLTATWSLYLNDDYEGGVLEFLHKPYTIKAKPGMLVSIPMTEEFTHRVTPVTKGIRHTLYGTCYKDPSDRFTSTAETC